MAGVFNLRKCQIIFQSYTILYTHSSVGEYVVPNRYIVVSLCDLNLHFSNGYLPYVYIA